MQKDFHYYCIFVLANLARFSQDEAKIIAYCSQYVDDSKDSKQIDVKGEKGEYKYRYDTVRTAHTGLKFHDWNVQKKVYFPFHFIPSKPIDGNDFSYITEADSNFAQLLLDKAIKDTTNLRLYRIGVALHTYADTWAHARFSGRKHKENDVRGIWRFEKGNWKKCTKIWDPLVDFLQKRVGHLQAFKHPDFCYEHWKYNDHVIDKWERENSKYFIEAAHAILKKLARAKGTFDVDTVWEENENKIKGVFERRPLYESKGFVRRQICEFKEIVINWLFKSESSELKVRCERWREAYKSLFKADGTGKNYQYNPKEWRDEAVKLSKAGKLEEFLETDWVQFQRAALKQRYFVLEHLM